MLDVRRTVARGSRLLGGLHRAFGLADLADPFVAVDVGDRRPVGRGRLASAAPSPVNGVFTCLGMCGSVGRVGTTTMGRNDDELRKELHERNVEGLVDLPEEERTEVVEAAEENPDPTTQREAIEQELMEL